MELVIYQTFAGLALLEQPFGKPESVAATGSIHDIRHAIGAGTASKMRALHSTGAESPPQGSQNHGMNHANVTARLLVLQNLNIFNGTSKLQNIPSAKQRPTQTKFGAALAHREFPQPGASRPPLARAGDPGQRM